MCMMQRTCVGWGGGVHDDASESVETRNHVSNDCVDEQVYVRVSCGIYLCPAASMQRTTLGPRVLLLALPARARCECPMRVASAPGIV